MFEIGDYRERKREEGLGNEGFTLAALFRKTLVWLGEEGKHLSFLFRLQLTESEAESIWALSVESMV